MKNIKYLLFCLSLVLFASCDKDNSQDCNSRLTIIQTIVDDSYKGGKATIEVSAEGCKAESNAHWIHPSVSGKTVILTLDPNPLYSQRTGILKISKFGQVQSLPISQLGIISIIEIQDYNFSYKGEQVAFKWETDQKYEIKNLPEWLSYSIEDNKITFTASELDITDNSREAMVDVVVGELYKKTFTFKQLVPALPYELIAGGYELSYVTWVGNEDKRKTIDVELVPNKNKTGFILTGIGYDIAVGFDEKLPGITINCQELNMQGKYGLYAWSGYSKGWLDYNPNFGVIGVCKNKKQIEFNLEANKADYSGWLDDNNKPIVVHGFIVWNKDGEYKGGISRILDIKLVKK